jgi:hypothetical protein
MLILLSFIPRWRESIACRLVSVSFSENIVWENLIGLEAAESRNLPARKTGLPDWYMKVRGREGFSTIGPLANTPGRVPETATVPERALRPPTGLLVVQRQVPTSSV